MTIPKADWKWYGGPGHFIMASCCRFHLCTEIGSHLVSTVGELWPRLSSRIIHAKCYDPEWLTANLHRKGDDFDHAYMQRFGYEDIRCNRKFETIVFSTTGARCECGCGLPRIIPSELNCEGYNDAASATAGHMALCVEYSNKGDSNESPTS